MHLAPGLMWIRPAIKLMLCLTVWTVTAICVPLHGAERYSFHRLSVEDGLSQVMVTCLLQDSQGFIWIGTKDGLNRYDGYEFEIFRRDPNAPETGLSNGHINDLLQDDNGQIWVATGGGGLNVFDPRTRSFRVYRTGGPKGVGLPSDHVVRLLIDREGYLWVGTARGLSRFNPETERFTPMLFVPTNQSYGSPTMIKNLLEDHQGNLWIGTNSGLYIMPPDRSKGIRPAQVTGAPELNRFPVNGLIQLPDQRLCVASERGLWIHDPEANRFDLFLEESRNQRVNIAAYYNDRLWVASNQELYIINTETGSYEIHRPDPDLPYTLSSGEINDALEDRNGLLWLGTMLGINQYDPQRRFKHLNREVGLLENSTYGLAEDRDGTVYIGTHNGGLHSFKPHTNQLRQIIRPGQIDTAIKCIQPLGNALWLGTYSSLFRFDPDKNKADKYSSAGDGALTGYQINYLAPDLLEPDHLWVGTNGGLNRLDVSLPNDVATVRSRPLESWFQGDIISTIHQSKLIQEPIIWVGTRGKGLIALNLDDGLVTRRQHLSGVDDSLSHNEILCITETFEPNGRTLWLGTAGGGLNAFTPHEERFIHFTTREGLPNDTVYGILEDHQGNLWGSTNRGLFRLDYRRENIVVFDPDSGLPGLEYNTGSFLKARDDQLYFGGIKGVTWFHPDEIMVTTVPPQVVITDFLIANKAVPIGPNQPIDVHISLADEVSLDHRQNVMTLSFAAMDYASPGLNRFAYRMNGFDEWQHTDASRRSVTYTNLDPGQYTFEVKAANRDGVWNEAGTSVRINVLPSPWRSHWAYSLYILLALTLILSFVNLQKRQLKKMNRRLEQEVGERTCELNQKVEELEAFGKIVNVVNREMNFDSVLELLLREALAIFPRADRGMFLRRMEGESFEVIAHSGYEGNLRGMVVVESSMDALYTNVFRDDAHGIITCSHLKNPYTMLPGTRVPQAQALTFIAIREQEEEIGLLTLVNVNDPDAFEFMDLTELARFRDYVLSAVIKTKITGDLLDAQTALVKTARKAGMSEVAGHIMHNLGNTLNQVRTGLGMMDEVLNESRAGELLRRIVSDETTRKRLVGTDKKGADLLAALETISEQFHTKKLRLQEENSEIKAKLDEASNTLWEQLSHITPAVPHERTQLNGILKRALELEGELLRRDHIEVHFDLHELPNVILDSERMTQVFSYLFENAREALQEREDGRLLEFFSRQEDDDVVLTMRDNGCGFSPEIQERVFFQGFSTHENKLGLGLHLSIIAVHEMGGALAIASDGHGQGATVTLRFPIADQEEAGKQAEYRTSS